MTDAAPGATANPSPGEQPSLPWQDPPRRSPAAASPVLAVDGFEGPLDWLLEMARSRKIDLARLSILALIEAFVSAMHVALTRGSDAPAPDLARWAAWTVMAAQLTELRSRLLLPPDAPAARTAQAEAEALRRQWVWRAEMAAAADWLERRPQLGFEVFARGRPDAALAQRAGGTARCEGDDAPGPGGRAAAVGAVGGREDELPVAGGDLTELLRACLMALRLPPHAESYQPRRLPFWGVADAVARVTRLLDELPDGADLAALLPGIAEAGAGRALHCRAALAATFAAALELNRNGALKLDQDCPWQSIQVRPCKSPPAGALTTTA